jgi:hypothetical protein
MIKPPPPKSTGIAWLALLFCVVALAAGVGFDMLSDGDNRLGLLAQPGARAVLGVAIAVTAIVAARLFRIVLGRRVEPEGGADARPHA